MGCNETIHVERREQQQREDTRHAERQAEGRAKTSKTQGREQEREGKQSRARTRESRQSRRSTEARREKRQGAQEQRGREEEHDREEERQTHVCTDADIPQSTEAPSKSESLTTSLCDGTEREPLVMKNLVLAKQQGVRQLQSGAHRLHRDKCSGWGSGTHCKYPTILRGLALNDAYWCPLILEGTTGCERYFQARFA